MLAGDYRRYLLSERGLSAASVSAYLAAARLFLGQLGQSGGLDLGKLTAGQVRIAVVQCGQRPVASAKVLVVGLRSLLRFLFLAGHARQQLAWAVPTPAGFAGGSLPRALEPGAVAVLLQAVTRAPPWDGGTSPFSCCWPASACGAVRRPPLHSMTSTGTGARSWSAARAAAGTGSRFPADVGEALVAYLRDGRPAVAGCRTLFLRVRAPMGALGTRGVANVVRLAGRRRRGCPPSARTGCATARPRPCCGTAPR